MKSIGTRSHIIVITLVAYLLSFSGIARADILCFGEDGHVSIDSVGAILPLAGIHFENDHDAASGQNPEHCEEDCRTCLDIPISSKTFQRFVAPNNEIQLALTQLPAWLSSLPPTVSSRGADPKLKPSTFHGANTAVSSLRSVVLLI